MFSCVSKAFITASLVGAIFSVQATQTAKPLQGSKHKAQPRLFKKPLVSKKDPLYWDWSSIEFDQLMFPEHFLWGVTTTAHQTEGNCSNNDWAAWEIKKKLEPTGKACDHWNNYKDDIQRIKAIGANSYRFSVEWSKIEPKEGTFDSSALDHYKDVCKELIAAGIKPVITLHHYTNPHWFAQKGAFEKEQNIHYFTRFCTHVFKQLNSFNPLWITFSSPVSYATRAYYKSLLPPGKDDPQLMQQVVCTMLNAHVQLYRTLKATPEGKRASIGITHSLYQLAPSNFWDKPACSTAHTLSNTNIFTFFKTGHFNASVPFKVSLKHSNPQAIGALDFIGLDYYGHGLMSGFEVIPYPKEVRTQQEIYTIYPEGLYCALHELNEELAQPLHIPIYITEHGISTHNEEHRELFFKRSLYALSYACNQGIPVKGYMVWTLMDSYDWGAHAAKFGIYEYNFKNRECSKKPRPGTKFLVDTFKKQSNQF